MIALRWLRALPLIAPSLAALAACDRPDFQLSDTAPVVGRAGSPTAGAGGRAAGCGLDGKQGATPIFAPQVVLGTAPARPVLYAYVSDADAASMRAAATLFPPLAQPGASPQVVNQLNRALTAAMPPARALIEALVPRFGRVRSTWPNLWPLRLIEHPGTEHMNPVRIVLRDDAWVGRIEGGSLSVFDVKNQLVSTDVALQSPERIAAIYFTLSPQASPGATFANCDQGFRDISLGNEGMVQSWELGTEQLLERIDLDVKLLSQLFDVARPCASVDKGGMTFHAYTVCNTWTSFSAVSEYSAYGLSLANPAELYKPSWQNLASLVEALKNDRFEPDAFVVEPERPEPWGMSGAGGADNVAGGAGNVAGAGGAP